MVGVISAIFIMTGALWILLPTMQHRLGINGTPEPFVLSW